MSAVFTPGESIRRDDGPTGEFPALAPSLRVPEGSMRAPAPLGLEVLDLVDFELRYSIERSLGEQPGETLRVCHDVWQDAMPRVVVQRLAAPSPARLHQITARAAVCHPGVATVLGLYRVGDDVGVVLDHADAERLDAWVTAEGPFTRAAAITLVDRLAAAVEALHAAGVTGLGLDASRIGLRWHEPDTPPEPVLGDLGEPAEGGAAADVGALAGALAYALTGDPDGRPALGGKALRAFLDRARHVDPRKRPADVHAFRRELGALSETGAGHGRRRGRLVAAAMLVVGLAAAGGWQWHQRPTPPPPLPPMTLELSAANDTAATPTPPARIAPLDAGYAERVGRVDALLARRATGRIDPKVDRDILRQLGEALAGRPATGADRERVATIASAQWYSRDAAGASAALGRALDARADDKVATTLDALYALDPTHPGAAFGQRHRQALRLVLEDDR